MEFEIIDDETLPSQRPKSALRQLHGRPPVRQMTDDVRPDVVAGLARDVQMR